jgi:hypothetical protein
MVPRASLAAVKSIWGSSSGLYMEKDNLTPHYLDLSGEKRKIKTPANNIILRNTSW